MIYIIDILRGFKSQKILDRRYEKFFIYGIGKDRIVEEWKNLVKFFLY